MSLAYNPQGAPRPFGLSSLYPEFREIIFSHQTCLERYHLQLFWKNFDKAEKNKDTVQPKTSMIARKLQRRGREE